MIFLDLQLVLALSFREQCMNTIDNVTNGTRKLSHTHHVCLSVYLPVYLSICLVVCLSLSLSSPRRLPEARSTLSGSMFQAEQDAFSQTRKIHTVSCVSQAHAHHVTVDLFVTGVSQVPEGFKEEENDIKEVCSNSEDDFRR